jgi:hypothetical protein
VYALLPLTVYLLYNDSNDLRKKLKSGLQGGLKSTKDLYPAMYPFLYVTLHLFSLKRVFLDPEKSPIDKIFEIETYAPTVLVQSKKVVNYYRAKYSIVDREINRQKSMRPSRLIRIICGENI